MRGPLQTSRDGQCATGPAIQMALAVTPGSRLRVIRRRRQLGALAAAPELGKVELRVRKIPRNMVLEIPAPDTPQR